MKKIKFHPIPVKPGDFVYLNYMDFGDKFVLCQAEADVLPGQIVVRGIVHCPAKSWNYSSFVIALNNHGNSKKLFDFSEHSDFDLLSHRKVWKAIWNPHY